MSADRLKNSECFYESSVSKHWKLSTRQPLSAAHMLASKQYLKPICYWGRNNLWNLNKLTSFPLSVLHTCLYSLQCSTKTAVWDLNRYTDCLPRYLVGTHVQCQNLNQFMNMERSSWNFRTVKQLVTQNVSINFCPHKPEIQNSETMINLAGPARWQLCGAPEEWPANWVLHV